MNLTMIVIHIMAGTLGGVLGSYMMMKAESTAAKIGVIAFWLIPLGILIYNA